MAKPHRIDPVLAPTVLEVGDVTDPGVSLAGPAWLLYDVAGPFHWKEPGVWEVYVGVLRPWRGPEFRCYRLRARKRATAIAGVAEAVASTFPTTLIVYEVRAPMTPEQIGRCQAFNARRTRLAEHRL